MNRRLCPCCDGAQYLDVHLGCGLAICPRCHGRGTVDSAPLSLPPAVAGVPSSGGNCPLGGGEEQIRKWVLPLALLLVILGCSSGATRVAAAPDGGAASAIGALFGQGFAADARPLDTTWPDARPLDALPPDALPMDARPADTQPADTQPVDAQSPDTGRPICPGENLTYVTVKDCLLYPDGVSCLVVTYRDGGVLFAPCFRHLSGATDAWYVTTCAQCYAVSP